MKALLAPLMELADYEEIAKNLKKQKGMLQIAGCVNSQKMHMMSALGEKTHYRLLVFADNEKAEQAFEEIRILNFQYTQKSKKNQETDSAVS